MIDNRRNDDDEALGAFLRSHAPAVPPPGPGLEERIVAAALRPAPSRRRVPRWLLAAGFGLAAAAAAAVTLLSRQPAPAPDDNIETFVTDSWEAVAFPATDDGDSLTTALASLE